MVNSWFHQPAGTQEFTISGLTVFHYQSLTGEYQVLLEQRSGVNIRSNVPFDFSVRIVQEIGVVTWNGHEVGTFSVKGRDMSGPWGIGTQALRGIGVIESVSITQD